MTTRSSRLNPTRLWGGARCLSALLILIAIIAQLHRTLVVAAGELTTWGSHIPTVLTNFFSFFTILSNLAAAAVLIVLGSRNLRKEHDGRRDPVVFALVLASATTYMLITGLVYNTLLRGVSLPQGATVGWSNEILHVIAPLLLVGDLLFGPGRRPLPWKSVGIILGFPIMWAVYTLVRADHVVAPSSGDNWWYPYPFLDPRVTGGYGGVALNILGIALAVVAIAVVVIWSGRNRQRVSHFAHVPLR